MFNTRWNNSVRTSLTWMTRTEKKIIKEKRETEFVHEKTKVKTRIRKRETRKSDRETLKMHTRFSELIWRRNEEGKSMNSVNVIRLIIEESNRSSTTRRCIEFCMFQIENSLPTTKGSPLILLTRRGRIRTETIVRMVRRRWRLRWNRCLPLWRRSCDNSFLNECWTRRNKRIS